MSSIHELTKALEGHSVIGVGDASVSSDSYASHAYILESKDEKHRIKGVAPVDCDEDDVDSTRAEKSGVLAMLTVLRVLENMYDLGKARVTIYSDNLEAVGIKRRPNYLLSYVRFNATCYDINEEVLQMLESTRLRIFFSHISGHQDRAKDFVYEEADQETRRNIDMDSNAKAFLKNPPPKLIPTRDAPFYTASQVALKIHDSYVVSNIDAHIRLHLHGPALEQRLVRKEIIKKDHLSWIQWRGFERAMKRFKTVARLPVVKIVYGMWCTAETVSEWYEEQSDTCLRCKNTTEIFEHVFQCRHTQARSTFTNAINAVRKRLRRCQTAPVVVSYVVNTLHEQRLGYDRRPDNYLLLNPQLRENAEKSRRNKSR